MQTGQIIHRTMKGQIAHHKTKGLRHICDFGGTVNYLGNSCEIGVYGIFNILNNKVYIGSTKSAFHTRKTKHLRLLINNRHHSEHLQNSWNKYGSDKFEFRVLCISSDVGDVEKSEGEFMKLYSSTNKEFGYNRQGAGDYKVAYKLKSLVVENRGRMKKEKATIISGHESLERGLNKAIKIFSLNGNLIEICSSQKGACKKYGFTKSHLNVILRGRRLVCKGFIVLDEPDTLKREDVLTAQLKMLRVKVDIVDMNGVLICENITYEDASNILNCKTADIRVAASRAKYIKKHKCKIIWNTKDRDLIRERLGMIS